MRNLNLMSYFLFGGVLTGLITLILVPFQRSYPPESSSQQRQNNIGDDLSRVDFTGSSNKYR